MKCYNGDEVCYPDFGRCDVCLHWLREGHVSLVAFVFAAWGYLYLHYFVLVVEVYKRTIHMECGEDG